MESNEIFPLFPSLLRPFPSLSLRLSLLMLYAQFFLHIIGILEQTQEGIYVITIPCIFYAAAAGQGKTQFLVEKVKLLCETVTV